MINISVTLTGFQTLDEAGDRVGILPPLIVPAVLKGWRTRHTARGIRSPTRRKIWWAVAAPLWGSILVCGVRKSRDSSKELMSQIIFPARVRADQVKRSWKGVHTTGILPSKQDQVPFYNWADWGSERWSPHSRSDWQNGRVQQQTKRIFALWEPSKQTVLLKMKKDLITLALD